MYKVLKTIGIFDNGKLVTYEAGDMLDEAGAKVIQNAFKNGKDTVLEKQEFKKVPVKKEDKKEN